MNTYDSVQCSKKWCTSLFDESFSKSSEAILGFVWSQNLGFRDRSLIEEHVRVRSMFKKWCSSSFDVRWNGVQPITINTKLLLNHLIMIPWCMEIISVKNVPKTKFIVLKYIFIWVPLYIYPSLPPLCCIETWKWH